ncbi:citrate lyase subunit alpha [Actinobacillus equuli]|nr:citrate lyase subunit alpha [Actinobacillus equuli]
MTTREQRVEKFNAGRPVYQAVPKAESLVRTAKTVKCVIA